MEELLKLLESFHALAADLHKHLLHNLPREVHWANKTILEEGQVCDWIAFVEKGLLKIYNEWKDGTERIIWFHKEGDIIGSMKSYYRNEPSQLTIQTLQETHIRKIKKTDLEEIYRKYPEFNINGRKITEDYYVLSEDHAILLSMSARERYEKLERDYPWILDDHRIKDYMLAEYLNMSKATLSKLRNGRK
ncbi:MAG: Crp/Fnr family transcriptional regulator [Bacteroidota bacterium]